MRTQLSQWQIKAQRSEQQMKYIELSHKTVAHLPGETVQYRLDFPTDTEGINIKSIKVVSDEAIEFNVAILDAVDSDIVYESLDEIKTHYDAIDVVYKSTQSALLVRIQNKGVLTTRFAIKIKGIEVT